MFWRRLAVRQRVLVNLQNGTAFNAILWKRKGPLLILRDATYLDQSAPGPAKLDGDVIVERERVDWIQVIGGGA